MFGQDFKATDFSFVMLINRVFMQNSHNGFLTATQNSVPLEELWEAPPHRGSTLRSPAT